MVRTQQESERRIETTDLLVLPRQAESLQNGIDFSRKTEANWACQTGKSGLRTTKRAVGTDARTTFAKR